MSREAIDLLWNEANNELKRLVQEEARSEEASPVSINEAFRHFAKLYIRYTLVLADLNKCLASAVQPQKCVDIQSTLEHVICRVINLRHLLVKWCPPNPDVLAQEGGQAPFPWEYLDLEAELRELSVPPSNLETEAPAFFKEAHGAATRQRNAAVARLLEEQFGAGGRPPEQKSWSVECVTAEVSDEGGQSDEEPAALSKAAVEVLPEQAAVTIQSAVRRHFSRRKTKDIKQWIDSLVGLSSNCCNTAELEKLERNLADVRHQRKQEQLYCKENYEHDLQRLKGVVRDEEGFAMQNQLREERIQWITDYTISNSVLPDSFEGFYAKKDAFQEDEQNDGTQESRSKKKENGKSAKGAKDNKKNKDKKSAEADVECPALVAHPTLLNPLRDSISIYEERWQSRNVGPARIQSQYPDAGMAKDLIIRDQVRKALTAGVEEKLLSNILKIKAMQESNKKNSKAKKDGKGKGKKKGKKAGGKKEKPLPGAKLPGMKEMSVDEMLKVLVQSGLVCTPQTHSMADFIGGFNNGHPNVTGTEKQERWIPDDPSAFQLRKTVMEYCILPLGSESIKARIQEAENVRSVLFYGPEGSGKTHMVQTVASEIGALLIHLSSATIGTSFGGKEGATKLIHMVFTVAKEKAHAPVIIYLDNCHEFFLGKAKKGGGSTGNAELQRFQKDLLVYKNQALKNEDRVLVLGCTPLPGTGDVKLLRWKGSKGKPEKQGFFERSLYFPRANHTDRAMLWKGFVRRRLSGCTAPSRTPHLDYATLASLSEGFTAGEIVSTVESVLSQDRLEALACEPLSELDFSRYLSRETDAPDDARFLAFTRQITTLDSVWKSLHAAEKTSGDSKKKKK